MTKYSVHYMIEKVREKVSLHWKTELKQSAAAARIIIGNRTIFQEGRLNMENQKNDELMTLGFYYGLMSKSEAELRDIRKQLSDREPGPLRDALLSLVDQQLHKEEHSEDSFMEHILRAFDNISNKMSSIANGIDVIASAVVADVPPTPEAVEGALIGYYDYLEYAVKELDELRDEISKAPAMPEH